MNDKKAVVCGTTVTTEMGTVSYTDPALMQRRIDLLVKKGYKIAYTEPEAETEVKTEVDEVKTEAETEVKTEVDEVKTEAETEVKTEAETEVKTEVDEVKTEAETEVNTETEAETEVDEANTEVETEVEEAEFNVEAKAEVKTAMAIAFETAEEASTKSDEETSTETAEEASATKAEVTPVSAKTKPRNKCDKLGRRFGLRPNQTHPTALAASREDCGTSGVDERFVRWDRSGTDPNRAHRRLHILGIRP